MYFVGKIKCFVTMTSHKFNEMVMDCKSILVLCIKCGELGARVFSYTTAVMVEILENSFRKWREGGREGEVSIRKVPPYNTCYYGGYLVQLRIKTAATIIMTCTLK